VPTKKFHDRPLLECSGYTPDRVALELPPGPSLSPDNRYFHTTPSVPRARIGFEIKTDRFFTKSLPNGSDCLSKPTLGPHRLWNIGHEAQDKRLQSTPRSGRRKISRSSMFLCEIVTELYGSAVKAGCLSDDTSSAPTKIRSTGNQSVRNRYQTPSKGVELQGT